MDASTVRAAAREAVIDLVGYGLKDSDPIVSSGLIDSLSVVKLIVRLEQKLKVKISSENIQPDDFDTVDKIIDTVARVAR